MLLKFWAFVYRLTGYYSNYARIKEYEYIRTRYWHAAKMYIHPENDMYLEDIIGIEIGSWQAKHGFYRPFKKVLKSMDKQLKKMKKD